MPDSLRFKAHRVICRAVYPTVWDGSGFYRRVPSGTFKWVFVDRSPYPEDDGSFVFGVADSMEEAHFNESGAPWTTTSLVRAIHFANGREG